MENPYLQFFRNYINQFVNPSSEEWHAFSASLTLTQFQKGEVIEAFDSAIRNLHFLVEGFARHYFTDAEGNEVTIWLSEPGGLSTDYAAFTKGGRTQYQIQAVTPVTCLSITSDALNALYDQSKTWERLGRLINQEYLNSFIDRNNFLISLSAKERYDYLFQLKPHYFNVYPLKHLASYIGVSMETLSRMRSNTY
jgi:CRP-like cAMP-binding protein